MGPQYGGGLAMLLVPDAWRRMVPADETEAAAVRVLRLLDLHGVHVQLLDGGLGDGRIVAGGGVVDGEPVHGWEWEDVSGFSRRELLNWLGY